VRVPACREILRLAPHRHSFRACFVAARVRGGTLASDGRSPPLRLCVHRRYPLTSRRSARVVGVPPDGLDQIHRAACTALGSYVVRSIFASAACFYPPRSRAHSALVAPDPQTGHSSFRMAAKASAVFQPTLGTFGASGPGFSTGARPPPKRLPRRGISAGCGTPLPRCRSSDRASPLFAPLPVPPRTDTFVTAS